jgi:hypothetical protein
MFSQLFHFKVEWKKYISVKVKPAKSSSHKPLRAVGGVLHYFLSQ